MGRFSLDLDSVLDHRARLLVAKQAGWAQFRAAWIDLMKMQTSPRGSAWGNALSKSKTHAEAAAIADAAWDRHQEVRWLVD